ncbi:hypothetical protein ACFLS1_03640 [Verrucomicrobiota bacterium]
MSIMRSVNVKLDAVPLQKHRLFIEAIVGYTVGSVLFFFGRKTIGVFALSAATFILLSGCFVPPLYFRLKKIISILAKAIGIAFSWVLLLPFFYICFTFGRICLLLSGKDPLKRKFSAGARTYWEPRKPVKDLEHYKRQY